jgi:hypothetical protein
VNVRRGLRLRPQSPGGVGYIRISAVSQSLPASIKHRNLGDRIKEERVPGTVTRGNVQPAAQEEETWRATCGSISLAPAFIQIRKVTISNRNETDSLR